MKRTLENVTNAEYAESYGSGFADDWEVIVDVESGKRVWFESTGTLDGEDVIIRFRPFDNYNDDMEAENACNWGAFWVFDEDASQIGTEYDFEIA